jgi:hypothetical protein
MIGSDHDTGSPWIDASKGGWELFETVARLRSSPIAMLEHRSPETIPAKLLPRDRFRLPLPLLSSD